MSPFWKLLAVVILSVITRCGQAVPHGFTVSPSHFVDGLTPRITFRCELGHYIHAVSHALVLQLSKVDKQTVATLVTEQQAGHGPTLVATSLRHRSRLEGKIDILDPSSTYLQMILDHPIASDSGKYMCTLTVMDRTNFIQTLTLNSTVTGENATTAGLLDTIKSLNHKMEEMSQKVVDSKNNYSTVEHRLAVLEGKHFNTTQKSVTLEAEVERLTEELRQINSDLVNLGNNSICPVSCVREMDIIESSLNVTTNLINEEMELIHAQENKTRVVFWAHHQNVPKGLVPLQHSKLIVFQEVLLNDGGGYDNVTGIFTAPVNGTYVFMLNIPIIDAESTRQFNIAMTVNFDDTIAQIENGANKTPNSVTVVRRLAAGDQVTVYAFQIAGQHTNDGPTFSKYASYFGGFLLD